MFTDWVRTRKASMVGALTGVLAGLVAVTPCAGYVPTWAAVVVALAAGGICYGATHLRAKRGWDDSLDVWGVHGVGGALGIIMLGLLASKAVNPGGADGLLAGNMGFFMKQVITVVCSSIYAFGFTFVMLWGINKVTRVKTTEGEEEAGLDDSLHGETAYQGV